MILNTFNCPKCKIVFESFKKYPKCPNCKGKTEKQIVWNGHYKVKGNSPASTQRNTK